LYRRSRLRLRWICLLRLGRELQYGSALACTKMREQHDLAVRKLQRIMVRAGIVYVHLPEPGHLMRQRVDPSEEKRESGEVPLDSVLENDLRARKEADGYFRFIRR